MWCVIKQIYSTFVKSSILGVLYKLWPVVLSKVKLYKIGSRTAFKMLLFIQSYFQCNPSIPVMSMGLSLLFEPGIIKIKPSKSPKGPKYGLVKRKIV